MTIQWGDTGKSMVGTKRKVVFSFPQTNANTEQLLTTPMVLPGTEPATPQAEFTLTQEMFPTTAGNVLSMYHSLIMIVVVKNRNTTSKAVTYRAFRNGVSEISGTLSTASVNNFQTISVTRFVDVKVGDKFGVALWDNGNTNLIDYIYKFMYIVPVQMQFSDKIITDLHIVAPGMYYLKNSPSDIVPNDLQTTNGGYLFNGGLGVSLGNGTSTTPLHIGAVSTPDYQLTYHYGDISTTTTATNSSTYYPFHVWNNLITEVTFRELDISADRM